MKYPKFRIIMALLIAVSMSGCAQLTRNLDVIGDGSIEAFAVVLDLASDCVSDDSQYGGWLLSAPDGSASFFWSSDWSITSEDVMFIIDAEPFITAGLNTTKLDGSYRLNGDMLLSGTDLGDAATTSSDALAAYSHIIDYSPDSLGYHMEMDHFSIDLSDGNQLGWAKDMAVSDNDLVFSLDPQPFITAGVDPTTVEGWQYRTTPTHIGGKTVEVYRFLKLVALN